MELENIKSALFAEKEELLNEIKKIAIDDNGDFVAKETSTNTDDVPDDVDLAGEQENFANNGAILNELETRLNNVDSALTRIEAGTYGICSQCGQEISEKRILANNAADKCIDCENKE